MGVSQDDIRSWKNDGWTFRIKTVKGKKYITRRKGKLEKGLGRFDEKLWKLIHRSSVISKRDEDRLDAQKIIGSLVHEIRGFDMSSDCSHIVDGFCYFWRFGDQPGFFRIADRVSLSDYYREVDFGGKPSFWVFKAVQFYCRGCSGYVRGQPNDRPRELILS